MDAVSKKIFDEPIVCKFSGVSWYKDEGFYYSKYDQPKKEAFFLE
jgi:prolyl oligopeptidase